MSKLKQKSKPDLPIVEVEPKPSVTNEPQWIIRDGGPPSKWMIMNDVARYLSVTPVSINRYMSDPAYAHLEFPKPSMLVDRCYWNVDDIDAWMRSRVGATSSRKIKSKKEVA